MLAKFCYTTRHDIGWVGKGFYSLDGYGLSFSPLLFFFGFYFVLYLSSFSLLMNCLFYQKKRRKPNACQACKQKRQQWNPDPSNQNRIQVSHTFNPPQVSLGLLYWTKIYSGPRYKVSSIVNWEFNKKNQTEKL